MADPIAPPFDARPIYLVLAFLGLLVLALWMTWRVSAYRAKVAPEFDLKRVSRAEKRTWLTEIDRVLTRYGDSDSRVYHLELAKILREAAGTRLGADVSSWTGADVSRVPQLASFGRLITAFEEPSFAESPASNPAESATVAKEAISRW